MSRLVGEVLALFISKRGESERHTQEAISVDSNGVLNDKFYAKDEERSVLLTTVESYAMAKRENIEMPYGTLGENILIDYNPYGLAMGQQIQMGEVLLKITQNCTICNHLSIVDKKLPKLLKDDRGIFIKVVKSGRIVKGDKIYLL